MLGVDGTGKFVDEVLTTCAGAEIIRAYIEILRTKQPQYRDGSLSSKDRSHVPFQRVAYPLARDGENVDMLIFMLVRVRG